MEEEHIFDDLKFGDFVAISELLDATVSDLKIKEQQIIMIIMMIGLQHAINALGKDVGLKTMRNMFEVGMNNVIDAHENRKAAKN
tara:strand:- start:1055 stop:1309 length:255 start_codon:yes stop_codon:yes gene_type:complete